MALRCPCTRLVAYCTPTGLLLPLHGPALPMRSPVCNLPQAPLVTGQLMEGSPGAR